MSPRLEVVQYDDEAIIAEIEAVATNKLMIEATAAAPVPDTSAQSDNLDAWHALKRIEYNGAR